MDVVDCRALWTEAKFGVAEQQQAEMPPEHIRKIIKDSVTGPSACSASVLRSGGRGPGVRRSLLVVMVCGLAWGDNGLFVVLGSVRFCQQIFCDDGHAGNALFNLMEQQCAWVRVLLLAVSRNSACSLWPAAPDQSDSGTGKSFCEKRTFRWRYSIPPGRPPDATCCHVHSHFLWTWTLWHDPSEKRDTKSLSAGSNRKCRCTDGFWPRGLHGDTRESNITQIGDTLDLKPLRQWISICFWLSQSSTVSQLRTLPRVLGTTVITVTCSRGYDPFTQVRWARPLTDVGWPVLRVSFSFSLSLSFWLSHWTKGFKRALFSDCRCPAAQAKVGVESTENDGMAKAGSAHDTTTAPLSGFAWTREHRTSQTCCERFQDERRTILFAATPRTKEQRFVPQMQVGEAQLDVHWREEDSSEAWPLRSPCIIAKDPDKDTFIEELQSSFNSKYTSLSENARKKNWFRRNMETFELWELTEKVRCTHCFRCSASGKYIAGVGRESFLTHKQIQGYRKRTQVESGTIWWNNSHVYWKICEGINRWAGNVLQGKEVAYESHEERALLDKWQILIRWNVSRTAAGRRMDRGAMVSTWCSRTRRPHKHCDARSKHTVQKALVLHLAQTLVKQESIAPTWRVQWNNYNMSSVLPAVMSSVLTCHRLSVFHSDPKTQSKQPQQQRQHIH